ncbi:MAG: 16S rRNA (cytidine(1402)-2'-O)-methyltransferase [Bacilli bacterium]|nr:16S rRNA (cytidine(1402)-2'-O)-methyltransferase [Bacilli bacterium]
MKLQKSQIDQGPILYLVPTPIGNIEDISPRAVDTLKKVDVILCEDTRVTKILLSHFNITATLISYHNFNEEERTEDALSILSKAKDIALVSDAGMPLVSDPGYVLVREAIEKGYRVISIPGPNAGITALIASGLPTEKFLFYGFLSSKPNKRRQEITQLQDIPYTILFYEAPHRINDTLADMEELLGTREVVVARELTKTYEEYVRGTLDEVKDLIYRGEIVIVLSGAKELKQVTSLNEKPIEEHYQFYLDQGLQDKEAMKQVASDRKVAKSTIYKTLESLKGSLK